MKLVAGRVAFVFGMIVVGCGGRRVFSVAASPLSEAIAS